MSAACCKIGALATGTHDVSLFALCCAVLCANTACAPTQAVANTAARQPLEYWRQHYQNGSHFSPDGAWFIRLNERPISPLTLELQSVENDRWRIQSDPIVGSGDQAYLPLGPSAWSPNSDAFALIIRRKASGLTSASARLAGDIPSIAIFRREGDALRVYPFEAPGISPPAVPIDERLPVAWSPDGQRIAVSFDFQTIWVLNNLGQPITAFIPELPHPLRMTLNSRHFDEVWWAGNDIALIVHDDWTAQELQVIAVDQPEKVLRYKTTSESLRILGVEPRGRQFLLWQRPRFRPASVVHFDLDSGQSNVLEIPLQFRTLVSTRQTFAYAAPMLADGQLWLYNWATRQLDRRDDVYEIVGCAIDTCTALKGKNRNNPFELIQISAR